MCGKVRGMTAEKSRCITAITSTAHSPLEIPEEAGKAAVQLSRDIGKTAPSWCNVTLIICPCFLSGELARGTWLNEASRGDGVSPGGLILGSPMRPTESLEAARHYLAQSITLPAINWAITPETLRRWRLPGNGPMAANAHSRTTLGEGHDQISRVSLAHTLCDKPRSSSIGQSWRAGLIPPASDTMRPFS